MHRAIPVGNKLCAKRNEQRAYDLHRDRVRAMRPQVDTAEPAVRQLDHIRNNLKREQMLEERYFDIDRENRILLQKMSDIMRQTTPATASSRGRSGPASMNRDFRKMELVRITQENQAILKRIQASQPVYNHVEWEASYKKNMGYMKNCCEYEPLGPGRPSTAGPEQLEPLGSSRGGSARRAETARSAGGEDGEPRFVLKEGKKIGDSIFLVEMATDGKHLSISAYCGETQRTLELELNDRSHQRHLRQVGGDYSKLASLLRIEGDQLLIEGSKEVTASNQSLGTSARSEGSTA